LAQKTIEELIQKQKLIESLVHRQNIPRQDLVESVVHRQHLAELRELLTQLDNAETASILDRLSEEDALLVWGQVDENRADDILCELSEDRRDMLATQGGPVETRSIINAFELSDGRLRQILITSTADLEGIRPIWIDLVDATKSDRLWIGEHFGLELPDPEDLTDLESSARFYVKDNGEIHLHSDFLLDQEGTSGNVPVALILYRDVLFSVRQEELPVFRLQRLRARIQSGWVTDGMDMLLDLYAVNAEYSADALEDIYAALGKVGKQVLSETMTDVEAARILAAIAEEEDLNGRIRRNLMDTRRAVTFLIRRKVLSSEQFNDAKQILRDIESLDGHTSFLFDKINFLMDATVGFININQNKIIKIFSVASVALLPPTLIASIYGMNFRKLPELDWQWGYPFALALMVISVAIPLLLFRRKGWLK